MEMLLSAGLCSGLFFCFFVFLGNYDGYVDDMGTMRSG